MAGTINGDVHQHLPARSVITLPHRAGVVPPRSGSFQRRQVVLPVDGSTRTIVLTGLGGVGKTQLAVDHAESAWAAGSLDVLLWITADSRNAVVGGYASLAADLTGIEDLDPVRGAERLLNWLASTTARWLVVLDDVSEPADLQGLWPSTEARGHTVVTTRRREAAMDGYRHALIDVDVFTPAESASFLRGMAIDGAADDVTGLGVDLGHLPLALAQAGAYMVDRQLSCGDYRVRFADRRRKLGTLFPAVGHLPIGHRRTIATTWSLSVELADQLVPAGLARPLLMVAAMLDPNGIPGEVFGTWPVLSLLEATTGQPVGEEDCSDGLSCLHRLSLISLARSASGREVRVHELVQRATRDEMSRAKLRSLTHIAVNALKALWPDEFLEGVQGQWLRANLAAVEAASDGLLWECACRKVLFSAAISLGNSGAVVAALGAFVRLKSTAEELLGPDDPDTLLARSHLARWTGACGDAAGAVAQFRALLPDVTRVLGRWDTETLGIRNDLAFWRSHAGDPAGALAEMRKLLPDQIGVLGHDHLVTLTTRNNIARLTGEAGNPHGARAAFRTLLPDLRRALGHDDVQTLTAAHNHAHWRGESGDPSGAIRESRAVLADRERVLGPDHPQTLSTRANIARWQGRAGDPGTAAEELSAVLADRIRLFGEEHPDTIMAMWENATWWRSAGKPAKTLAVLETLLAVLERVDDPDSPFERAVRVEIAECRRPGWWRRFIGQRRWTAQV